MIIIWLCLVIGPMVLFKMKSLALLLTLMWSAASTQDVRYVKPNNSSCSYQPCLTLDQYMEQANTYFTPRATFLFLAGNHSLQTALSLINISDITLKGKQNDSDIKIICKNEVTFSCENITNLSIEGLTFLLYSSDTHRNASVLRISNSQSVQISNSIFHGNGDLNKKLVRAIYSIHSTIVIVHCHFKGNTGYFGGAIYAEVKSNITLVGSIFITNKAVKEGGAIYVKRSTLGVKDMLSRGIVQTSAENTICNDTCAIEINSAMPIVAKEIHTAHFFNNQAQEGGGIYLQKSKALLSGTLIIMDNNSAGRGGAIFSNNSEITANTNFLYFSSNRAHSSGGAINGIKGFLNLGESNLYFLNNSGGRSGGAIEFNFGDLNLKGNSCFTSNRAKVRGGAINSHRVTLLISGRALFSHNEVTHQGGAIYISQGSVIINGTVNGTSADAGGERAGIGPRQAPETKQLNFIGNVAENNGGGIYCYSTKLSVLSVSFIRNTGKCGGAVYIIEERDITFHDTTITGNSKSAVCASESSIAISGTTRIDKNVGEFGGGFHLENSVISFTGYNLFQNTELTLVVLSMGYTVKFHSMVSLCSFTTQLIEMVEQSMYQILILILV